MAQAASVGKERRPHCLSRPALCAVFHAAMHAAALVSRMCAQAVVSAPLQDSAWDSDSGDARDFCSSFYS